jgi:hypothetical protein
MKKYLVPILAFSLICAIALVPSNVVADDGADSSDWIIELPLSDWLPTATITIDPLNMVITITCDLGNWVIDLSEMVIEASDFEVGVIITAMETEFALLDAKASALFLDLYGIDFKVFVDSITILCSQLLESFKLAISTGPFSFSLSCLWSLQGFIPDFIFDLFGESIMSFVIWIIETLFDVDLPTIPPQLLKLIDLIAIIKLIVDVEHIAFSLLPYLLLIFIPIPLPGIDLDYEWPWAANALPAE